MKVKEKLESVIEEMNAVEYSRESLINLIVYKEGEVSAYAALKNLIKLLGKGNDETVCRITDMLIESYSHEMERKVDSIEEKEKMSLLIIASYFLSPQMLMRIMLTGLSKEGEW